MDKWSWCNEANQNLVCAGIVALWLYFLYDGRFIPVQLDMAFAAVLLFLGFKGYKGK